MGHCVQFLPLRLTIPENSTAATLLEGTRRQFLTAQLRDRPYEVFCCLHLDNRHRLIHFEEVFRGTIDGASVHPREIVRQALQYNAAALIFAHNHPSGVAEASQAIATVLHELATNAAKYGAFSVPDGRVMVWWSFAEGAVGASHLVVRWEERGGPPVVAPTRVGFGTRTIRSTMPHQLDGRVDLTFATEGASCVIELPLNRIEQGAS